MVPAVVLQQEVDALELERHRAAEIVLPLDRRPAHDDLALLERPVGEADAVGRLVGLHLDPGDEERAPCVAPYDELRPIERHRVEAQLAGEDRHPGHRDADVLERETLSAARVEDLHSRELEPRVEAEPLRGDAADLDPLAERARDRGLDFRFVIRDRRQHPEAEREHRGREDEVERDQRPAGPPEPLQPAALDRGELRLDGLVGGVWEEAHFGGASSRRRSVAIRSVHSRRAPGSRARTGRKGVPDTIRTVR